MKRTFNYCFIVSKNTGVITVEQKRINNALMENRNANHQISYENSQWLSQLGSIQKQMYVDLRKGIDFEIDKNDGSVKIVEKMAPDKKYCPSPISAINRFGVYAAL